VSNRGASGEGLPTVRATAPAGTGSGVGEGAVRGRLLGDSIHALPCGVVRGLDFLPALAAEDGHEARTVCFCQPVASMISASVTPLSRLISAITSAFLLVRSPFALFCASSCRCRTSRRVRPKTIRWSRLRLGQCRRCVASVEAQVPARGTEREEAHGSGVRDRRDVGRQQRVRWLLPGPVRAGVRVPNRGRDHQRRRRCPRSISGNRVSGIIAATVPADIVHANGRTYRRVEHGRTGGGSGLTPPGAASR
jgi:hypothetical protein